MKYKQLIIWLLILSLPLNLNASVAEKIDKWFDGQNYLSTTKPGIYEGQSARYATLGGISTRNAIMKPFDIIDLQPPRFSAGCGGIDFYTGGFSAIDSEQFINGLRAIGQSAQSFAFMLAVQVVSPQFAGVMQKIQEWANEFKKLSKDSCAIASQVLGGAMDQLGTREGNCTIKRMSDFGENWEVANYACTNKGQIKSTEAAGEGPNKFAFVKGNLTWYVLMQDEYFKTDLEFAEIIMNLIGTIIIKDAADSATSINTTSEILMLDPSLQGEIKNERFESIEQAVLHGNSTSNSLLIYRCEKLNNNPNGCEALQKEIQRFSPNWEGLYIKVDKLVNSIVKKIYQDEELSAQEKGFINATSLPLYRFLTVITAYHPSGNLSASLYQEYTHLIAEDIMLRSLSMVVARVDQRASMLKNGMSTSVQVKQFKEKLQAVLSGIAHLSKENRLSADKSLEMLQRIQMYEKTLMSKISGGFISSALWGSR